MVYIHNNPVKVGIVTEAADYSYSGLQCYHSRSGLVDLAAAGEIFDADAENVEAIMEERSAQADGNCPEWLDVEEERRSPQEIAARVIAGCGVPAELLKHDKARLKKAAETMLNAGLTRTEIAEAAGVSRQWLRTLM